MSCYCDTDLEATHQKLNISHHIKNLISLHKKLRYDNKLISPNVDSIMPEELTLGNLTTRTVAMPSDTNPAGDIFGGWVLSQMDIAAGICAGQRAQSRVATVSLESMSFIRPVKVGDILGVYTRVAKVGNTSIKVHVEAFVRRGRIGNREKVTEGHFTFVALDEEGKPKKVPEVSELPEYMQEKLKNPGGLM